MQTYSCTPKAQNYRALIAISILAFCLVVVSLLLIFNLGPLILNQALFLVFAAAVVFLFIKYFVVSYTYTVTLLKNDPVLIVTKKQGRRTTTVYHGELSTLKDIQEHDESSDEKKRQLRVDVRYSFFVSIRPERWQTLYFLLEDGTCVSLKLECDEAFLKIFREALAFVRSHLREPDDVLDADSDAEA
jgi:hypothetical protein